MRRLPVLAIAAVLLLAVSSPALAYPRVLLDAVRQAYAPRRPQIQALCHEKIGKSTYARVDVTFGASDRRRSVAFQWVGGWRPIWKDGALLSVVPKRERPHFRWIMRELNRFCNR